LSTDRQPGTAKQATVYDGRLFKRILAFLLPYKGWVIVAFVMVVAVAFLGPLQPRLVQIAIDDHIVAGD
jgi:ATP-binding cassette, subfamily B, multidrug efflux pump